MRTSEYLHAQEWIKGRSNILLTMPVWTWPEMEALWRALYKDKVSGVVLVYRPAMHSSGCKLCPCLHILVRQGRVM
jgi:hypothetical protein